MTRLGETGLYAITGETGAGKTTIFDAIMYALYDTGSGRDQKRKKPALGLRGQTDGNLRGNGVPKRG